MKKIKLLMPIVGVSTIAATAIPLASCQKQTTTYTVTFDSQGGSEIAAMKIEKDGTAIEPKDPTKDGFDFAGWYTDKECTNAFDFKTKITANITLYAKWTVQFSGEVTNEQWIAALAYLSGNVEGAAWKTSSEDVFESFIYDETLVN